MRPLIGIPLSLDDAGSLRPGRASEYLDPAYARALRESGAVPVYLPHGAGLELAPRLDGLLIPGGGDFLPPRPDFHAGVAFRPVPEAKLADDRALLADALSRDLPFLGVCYGMQLLALALGGALLYDLERDAPDADPHQLPEGATHPVHVEPGTRLAKILGEGACEVNSRHHQAVSLAAPDPASGLRASARAADGIVEAVERDGARLCLGVQWHPEDMPAAHRQRLFGALAAACARR